MLEAPGWSDSKGTTTNHQTLHQNMQLTLRAARWVGKHLRHVVLHRFDHDLMLLLRRDDLQPARPADARMWHVTITTDLIRSVADDNAFAHGVSQCA